MVELMDVRSCYMSIVASLTQDPRLINELLQSDIYSDCVSQMKLNVTRSDIKPYFQKYILSKPGDLKRAMKVKTKKNRPELTRAVYNYMEQNFPVSHAFILSSPLVLSLTLDRNLKIHNKQVKGLIKTLQETEHSLISSIRPKCNGTTFTVHDSVLSDNPIQTIDFTRETQKLLFHTNMTNSPSNVINHSVTPMRT